MIYLSESLSEPASLSASLSSADFSSAGASSETGSSFSGSSAFSGACSAGSGFASVELQVAHFAAVARARFQNESILLVVDLDHFAADAADRFDLAARFDGIDRVVEVFLFFLIADVRPNEKRNQQNDDHADKDVRNNVARQKIIKH